MKIKAVATWKVVLSLLVFIFVSVLNGLVWAQSGLSYVIVDTG